MHRVVIKLQVTPPEKPLFTLNLHLQAHTFLLLFYMVNLHFVWEAYYMKIKKLYPLCSIKQKRPCASFWSLSLSLFLFSWGTRAIVSTEPGLKLYEWAFPSLIFGLILSRYIENYFAIINSFEWVFSEVAQRIRKGEYCNYWSCTMLKVAWSVLRLFWTSDFVSWNNFAQVNHLKLNCNL